MSSVLKITDNSLTVTSVEPININKKLSKFNTSSKISSNYCDADNILDNTISDLQQDFEIDSLTSSSLPRRKQAKPQRRLETSSNNIGKANKLHSFKENENFNGK